MPFIGNQPALSYTSFAKQDFTTSATTSYTLDNPVANENELALFINFVRQEPTTAYTASGTSLTLTSATSASDDMYCVFLGKAVQTVNPPSGSVGASQIADSSIALGKLSATGTKDSTTFLRGDNTFAEAGGGVNTPAFLANVDPQQSVSNNTVTKAQMALEVIDTDGCYDNSTNYRFTPTTAGKYFVFCSIQAGSTVADTVRYAKLMLYKNNNTYQSSVFDSPDSTPDSKIILNISTIVDMNGSSDNIEVYGQIDVSSGTPRFEEGDKSSIFGAYRIIE